MSPLPSLPLPILSPLDGPSRQSRPASRPGGPARRLAPAAASPPASAQPSARLFPSRALCSVVFSVDQARCSLYAVSDSAQPCPAPCARHSLRLPVRGGPLRRSACALAREQDRSPSRVACLALPCAPPQAPRPSARNAKPLPLHSCPAAGPTGPLLIFPASPTLPCAISSARI